MPTQNVTKPAEGSTRPGATAPKRKHSDTGAESNKRLKVSDGEKTSVHQTKSRKKSKPKKKILYHLRVSLDPGTEFCKAAILVIKKATVNGKTLPDECGPCEIVKFPDGKSFVRPQVAFRSVTRRGSRQSIPIPLFGHEVDEALKNDEIDAHEIIRHFKPMIYKGHMAAQRKPVDETLELQGQVENLNLDMKNSAGEFGTHHEENETPGNEKDLQETIVPLRLFSQLLQWLLQCAVEFAVTNHPELQWPKSEQPSDLKRLLLEKAQNIRIALAILQTTLSFTGNTSCSSQGGWYPRTIALLGVRGCTGAKTLFENTRPEPVVTEQNLHAHRHRSVSPLKVSEELPPVTEWAGGSEVNGDAAAFFMKAMKNLKETMTSMQETRVQQARCQASDLKHRMGWKSLDLESIKKIKKIQRRGLTRRMLEEEIAEAFEHWQGRPANKASDRFLKVRGLLFRF
ncbi:uncharacterized protein A1O5_06984 [Cladophialophora psammophila CBS 110553]|uniref:Uncharacterized protein n=1 Tax=Cladophialophora psammophila CBS 110553 TaxID=1182543 RepID=W9WZ29_9EURO|nr:uncharacterized protein A1O5_06984 [Cladophialophora psammophila CBS 110553]EXJ69911.1 hypothetical protein A1O5_06984 [Cladophialophora psammophila CBS 110553]